MTITMTDLIIMNQTQTMSSIEIAKLTSKEHKNVLRDIRDMLSKLDGSNLSHEQYQELKDERGYVKEILLDKELSTTLVSGYSVPMRHKIIKRWQELEQVTQAISQAIKRKTYGCDTLNLNEINQLDAKSAYTVIAHKPLRQDSKPVTFALNT